MEGKIMTETFVEYGQDKIKSQSTSICAQAKILKVVDEAGYCVAANVIKALTDIKKQVICYFEPVKANAYATWREICIKEKEQLAPLEDADEVVRKSISQYLTKIETDRKTAQEKAEQEAKEVAEKERQKLLAKAEKAKTEEKRESLLEKAENVYPEPVYVQPYIDKTIKTNNVAVTRKTDIKVTVTDPLLLIQAIAAKKAPISAVEFKPMALKTWVKSMGLKNGDIPGITIEEVMEVSVRGTL